MNQPPPEPLSNQPSDERPPLIKSIMSLIMLLGWWGIIRSAMRIRYDIWGVLFAAVHVLAVIGLFVFYGWVIEPQGMKRVLFGRLKGKFKGKSGAGESWYE